MVHAVLAVLHTCATQGGSNYFPIHDYISSGSATGLGNFIHNATCPDFALSQDYIDLLRGKVAAEAVGWTPRHQFFINALTTEAVGPAKEPEGWRRRRN
jgi:hypothetical protein